MVEVEVEVEGVLSRSSRTRVGESSCAQHFRLTAPRCAVWEQKLCWRRCSAGGPSAQEPEPAAASGCGSAHVRPFFRQHVEALRTASSGRAGPWMGAIASAGASEAAKAPIRPLMKFS